MKFATKLIATAAATLVSGMALADITIGVSIPLTGPASGLGIPMKTRLLCGPKKSVAKRSRSSCWMTRLIRHKASRTPAVW